MSALLECNCYVRVAAARAGPTLHAETCPMRTGKAGAASRSERGEPFNETCAGSWNAAEAAQSPQEGAARKVERSCFCGDVMLAEGRGYYDAAANRTHTHVACQVGQWTAASTSDRRPSNESSESPQVGAACPNCARYRARIHEVAADGDRRLSVVQRKLTDYQQTYDWARDLLDPHGHGLHRSQIETAQASLYPPLIAEMRDRIDADWTAGPQRTFSGRREPKWCPHEVAAEPGRSTSDRPPASESPGPLAALLDDLGRIEALCARALAGDKEKKLLIKTLQLVIENVQTARAALRESSAERGGVANESGGAARGSPEEGR